VHVTGIPIAPTFAAAPEQRQARAELQLAMDQLVVLMMSGGAGVGDIAALIAQLLATGPNCQIVALAGRNARLLEELTAIAARYPGRLLPMGCTTTIWRVMAAADVAVAKPGGLTSAECLAIGLPMIVVAPIPGQEERNADYLLECGAALKAVDAGALVFKLRLLLQEPQRLESMRRNARAAGKTFAARNVLDIVRAHLHAQAPSRQGMPR
jgi:processive 1,2-diacylglycerol beta-glucosyltransferase